MPKRQQRDQRQARARTRATPPTALRSSKRRRSAISTASIAKAIALWPDGIEPALSGVPTTFR